MYSFQLLQERYETLQTKEEDDVVDLNLRERVTEMMHFDNNSRFSVEIEEEEDEDVQIKEESSEMHPYLMGQLSMEEINSVTSRV